MMERQAEPRRVTLYDVERGLVESLEALADVEEFGMDDASVHVQQQLTKLDQYLVAAADKRDRLAKFLLAAGGRVRIIEEEAKWHREQAAAADARAGVLDRAIKRLHAYVVFVMNSAQTRRFEGEAHRMRLVKNPDRVLVIDESLIPKRMMRQPTIPKLEPDKRLILEALKANKLVPGAIIAEATDRLVVE